MKIEVPDQLLDVIKAGVKANSEVPGSIALGGTICSLFAHHRLSSDIDFVLSDLSQRFDEVREHLFEIPEWKERRVSIPLTILGTLDGVRVGYRQLRRNTPLQTQVIETPLGELVVLTLDELIRTKAFLCYNRNYTRDFVDFAELSCLFEVEAVVEILSDLDKKFIWEKQPSILIEVIKKLLLPEPHDLNDTVHGFKQLRFLEPKLTSWDEIAARCREIGRLLSIKMVAEMVDET
ncbi:MAG: nucleotidyl transferase AbiEii/AbiGii toxin family protein [Acidobacteria bacterium]|nr:nucleotidyl transferase AbiEii/AbiGii toxin family protein [Acidobacteriota bacterium]